MRKLLSLVLLAVFGLPLVLPALAGGMASESAVPACCRRAGLHHCAMHQNLPAPAGTRLALLTERCPYTPQTVPVAHAGQWSFTPGGPLAAPALAQLSGVRKLNPSSASHAIAPAANAARPRWPSPSPRTQNLARRRCAPSLAVQQIPDARPPAVPAARRSQRAAARSR